MARNVTFTIDETLLEEARAAARADSTSLNEQFRLWLQRYAHERKMQQYETVMADLRGKLAVGGKLTRDEMNER